MTIRKNCPEWHSLNDTPFIFVLKEKRCAKAMLCSVKSAFSLLLSLSFVLYYIWTDMSTLDFAIFRIALLAEVMLFFCCEVPDLAIPYGTTEGPDRDMPSARRRSLVAPRR